EKEKYINLFNDILSEKRHILYIAHHRLKRSPGQRFRFELFINFLQKNGYKIKHSFLLSEKDDRIFYSKGNYLGKASILLKSFFKRWKSVNQAHKFDAVIVYREAYMLGTLLFEKILKRKNKNVIYDFDDAIWIRDVSEGNVAVKWLKTPSKTANIITMSRFVLAGNQYLADYARKLNKNTIVFPTVIDTNYHTPSTNHEKSSICIGWTGSSTTLKHFFIAIPVLKKIKDKYGSKVRFKVIVDADYKNEELEIVSCKWNIDTEIKDLQDIDIGIMPLPDDDWSKGKCGFKGLQYMALEIPAIMSPVGVNTELIKDGENGYLANNQDEWFSKISTLIDSKEKRVQMGKKGKILVEEKYSLKAHQNNLLKIINSLIEN
ncbi:MAG: glycosyl transferase family 1, partial [Marinilabiliales bacterium]